MTAVPYRLPILLLLTTACLLGQLPTRNAFQRDAGNGASAAVAPAPPADAVLEFSGLMKLGSTTMVCITTLADKRTRWIKVGESSDGITVPPQEAPTHSVTVRHAGREVTLPFKQPTYDASALAESYQLSALPAGPAPMAGVAPAVALTNEEKETEARMLVSDLLEIGMIQRKAYQEAKQREIEEKRAAREATQDATAQNRPPPR